MEFLQLNKIHPIDDLSKTCYLPELPLSLDVSGQLNVLVWNIYKENQSTWRKALTQLSKQKQLVLLQESSLTPELGNWAIDEHWQGMQAHAFSMLGTAMGVMNLYQDVSASICAYTAMEPWIRLPESALVASCPSTQTRWSLAAASIHAINFTMGIEDYQAQLEITGDYAEVKHQGHPV
ncbi:hypothetical protein P4S72_01620 [Vibrio sp. PP-XX7]